MTRTMPPVDDQITVLMSGVDYGDALLRQQMERELRLLIEQDRPLAGQVGRAGHQLISGFDAAITTCIGSDRPRACTVLYDHPVFAQRQAQMLWNLWARAQRLDWFSRVHMIARVDGRGDPSHSTYDLAYEWTPFSHYDKPDAVAARMQQLARQLMPGAVAFVVGPSTVADGCRAAGMHVQAITPVASLPTFRMHQSVLPRAQLKPGLFLLELFHGPTFAFKDVAMQVLPLQGNCGTDQAWVCMTCLLYTSPSPRDRTRSRMPSSA